MNLTEVVCNICFEISDIYVLNENDICYKCEMEGWK